MESLTTLVRDHIVAEIFQSFRYQSRKLDQLRSLYKAQYRRLLKSTYIAHAAETERDIHVARVAAGARIYRFKHLIKVHSLNRDDWQLEIHAAIGSIKESKGIIKRVAEQLERWEKVLGDRHRLRAAFISLYIATTALLLNAAVNIWRVYEDYFSPSAEARHAISLPTSVLSLFPPLDGNAKKPFKKSNLPTSVPIQTKRSDLTPASPHAS